jgi:hypothetical protein
MMEWRPLLFNRFTVSFLVIGLIVVVVRTHMSHHDDGILEGKVVTQDGRPAVGVTVTLLSPGVVGFDPIDRTITDGEGRFHFEKHNQHHPVLKAEKKGVGESERVDIRLYFRNQNRQLLKPIVIKPIV